MSTTTIDDQSTNVKYSGNWVKGGTVHEYQGTVSSSTTVGDSFTLTFTGTSIAVHGTLDDFSAGAAATYAIDGGGAVEVVAPSAHGDTYDQLFWQSPPFSNRQHTLVVTMTKVNPNTQQGEGTIWFDSFVADTPPLSSASSPSIPVSSTSLTSSSYGISTSSSIVSGTVVPVTNPNNNTSSKSTPTGAIIGGVIAGLIIILVFIAFLLHRRLRRPEQNSLVQPRKPYFDGEVPPHLPFTPGPGSLPSHLSAQPFLPVMSINGAPPSSSPPIAPSNYYYNANAPPVSQFGNAAASYGPFEPRATGVPAGALAAAAGTHQYHNSIATGEGAYPTFNPYETPTPKSMADPDTSTGAGTSDHGELVGALKRRQQEVVLSYNPGVGGSPQPPVLQRHVDSGLRAVNDSNVHSSMPVVELPPVYSAA